jgi:hypothetical protein
VRVPFIHKRVSHAKDFVKDGTTFGHI